MTARYIRHLLVLAAFVLASFGRVGMAEAMPPHQADATMAAHCPGEPAPAPDGNKNAAVDCMTACAAIAPPAGPAVASPPACAMAGVTVLAFAFSGFRPEAEPPPPRTS